MTAPSAPAAARPSGIEHWRFPNRATPPGSSAYYSIRFAPPSLRDALAALFAWRAELRRVLDEVSEPGVAHLKLEWWRDETRHAVTGTPRHPLSHALAPAVAAHALPVEPFLDLVNRVEAELGRERSSDQLAQQQADQQDRGALFELICRCHDETDRHPLTTARRAGAWCQQVRRLRDGGLLLRRGREVVPEDRLRAAGLSHEALTSQEQRCRLPELLLPIADTLRDERPARSDLTRLPRVLRIQVRIHDALLGELARSNFAVVDQRIVLTPLRKLLLAWGTRR